MKEKYFNWLINVDEKKITIRSSFWNLCASLLNSFLTAILLFFITRLINSDVAGMFSIAAAISYQCISIGAFGVRNVHAADVNYEYSFKEYFYLRVFSGILMYCFLIYMAFFQGYTLEKGMIVFTFGIFKSIDSLEDLYHGEYQRNERLDVAVILQTFRYLISIIIFVLAIIISRNLIFSCTIASITTIIIAILQNKQIYYYVVKKKKDFSFSKLKSLFFVCLPICASNVINMYIVNVPKYAIDATLTDTIQTYYGVLSMPVFTINLLSTVIYRPMITKLSISWQKQQFSDFQKLMIKQLGIIFFLTMSITLFGYIIGLKLLQMIYGVPIMQYMPAFIGLLIGGGLNTIANFMNVLLTIQREQKVIFIAYIIDFVFCILFANTIVGTLHMNGASLIYIISNFILAFILTARCIYIFLKERKKAYNG